MMFGLCFWHISSKYVPIWLQKNKKVTVKNYYFKTVVHVIVHTFPCLIQSMVFSGMALQQYMLKIRISVWQYFCFRDSKQIVMLFEPHWNPLV